MNLCRRQGGAASLTGIFVLGMAVLFAALAIDTGRLGWEAKKMQNIADVAALRAISQAGPCSGVTTLDQATLESAAQAGAAGNGYNGDLVAESGVVAGTLTTVGGKRIFTPAVSIAEANAVQVAVSRSITSSLIAGGWLGGTTTLQRQAVAYDEVKGGISAGSTLKAVNSDDARVLNALLSSLLGGVVNLGALSYQGLASAEVSLGELATAAGPSGVGVSVGSVDSLLQADVNAGQFLQIVATALGNGHTAYADVNGLATVTTNVNNFTVGNLLSVTNDNPENATDATINVFSLISGGAQIANSNSSANLPMTLNLPLGLGDVNVELYIIDSPLYEFGPPGLDADGNWKTQVHSGQSQMQISVTLTGGDPILGGLVNISGNLSLYADMTSATTAWLETIQCANAATLAHTANIGVQTSTTEMGVGQFSDISDPASGTAPSSTLNIDVAGGLVFLNADVSAPLQTAPAQNALLTFSVDHDSPLPQTESVSPALGDVLNNTTSSLANSLSVTVSGGGPLVDPLLGGVGLSGPIIETGLENDLLSPLLTALDDLLLEPLFRGLGVHPQGSEVTLHAIEQQEPRLAI